MFHYLKLTMRHSAVYGVGQIANQIISFVLIPVYTRILTPNDYGIIALLGLLSAILEILIPLGLTSALFRFYFDYNEEEKRKKVISTSFLVIALLSIAYVLLSYFASGYVSKILFKTAVYEYYIRIVFLYTAIGVIINIPFIIFRVRNESGKFAILNTTKFLINVIFNITLVVFIFRNIEGVLYGNLLSALVMFLIIIWSLRKYVSLKFDLRELKAMLIYGLPFLPHYLSAQLLMLSDRYIMSHFLTLKDVGIYSVSYRFATVLGIVLGAIQSALSPILFSIMKEKNINEILSMIVTYYFLFVCFLCVVISAFSRELLMIMTVKEFYEGYVVIPIVSLSYVFWGMYFMSSFGIDITKKTYYLPFVTAASAVVNIVANLILIPMFGIKGAAWSAVAGYFTMFSITYLIGRKIYPINYEYDRLLKIAVVAVVVYVLSLFINFNNIIINIVVKMILVMVFPIMLFLARFFRRNEIIKMKELLNRYAG